MVVAYLCNGTSPLPDDVIVANTPAKPAFDRSLLHTPWSRRVGRRVRHKTWRKSLSLLSPPFISLIRSLHATAKMAADGRISLDKQHDEIKQHCRARESVSSSYARDPSKPPGQIADHLYGSHHLQTLVTAAPESRGTNSAEALEWARQCGDFGDTRPSDLFLHAFHDLLQCLHHDPMANCVSPPLCGSTGYAPLTVRAHKPRPTLVEPTEIDDEHRSSRRLTIN